MSNWFNSVIEWLQWGSKTTEDDASKSLMRLNDDCLRHIFNYSDKEDLCRFADVCTRLRPIAGQTYHKQYGSSKSFFRREICKFGHLITSLTVYGYNKNAVMSPEEYFQSMPKYCTNLTNLELLDTEMDCDAVKFIFERLKRLDIIYGKFIGNASTLFTNCSKLEHLRISHCTGFRDEFIVMKFPNLVELELFSYNHHNFESFRSFLSLNPQLQRLNIHVEDTKYFSAIAQFARNLKNLEIDLSQGYPPQTEDLLLIGKLTQLRKLSLRGDFMEANTVAALMMAFLRKNVALEHLNIEFRHVSFNDIKAIVRLKSLKILKLSEIECYSDYVLTSLAPQLSFLTELRLTFKWERSYNLLTPNSGALLKSIVKGGKHLDLIGLYSIRNFQIDLTEYEALLEEASNRLSKNKLTIEIKGCTISTAVNVPQDIQQKHKHQLEILLF